MTCLSLKIKSSQIGFESGTMNCSYYMIACIPVAHYTRSGDPRPVRYNKRMSNKIFESFIKMKVSPQITIMPYH